MNGCQSIGAEAGCRSGPGGDCCWPRRCRLTDSDLADPLLEVEKALW